MKALAVRLAAVDQPAGAAAAEHGVTADLVVAADREASERRRGAQVEVAQVFQLLVVASVLHAAGAVVADFRRDTPTGPNVPR